MGGCNIALYRNKRDLNVKLVAKFIYFYYLRYIIQREMSRNQNCLTRALDQWNEDRNEYQIWYNGNHVIAIENFYEPSDLTMTKMWGCPDYKHLSDYGYVHFISSFDITPEYDLLLQDYFESIKDGRE